MIKERMLELLILGKIIEGMTNDKVLKYAGREYDAQKILKRTKTLLEEFLDPYVIESDSKE